MSWDYSRYEAHCEDCGKEGFRINGSDDWGNSSTTWEGFETQSPSDYEVVRKRIGPDELAKCFCGSSRVVVGKLVGSA